MAGDDDAIVVMMTASSREEAMSIADALIESCLAACVQVLPEMLSVYRWQDQVEHSAEHLMLAKTTRARFAELEQSVRALHSYDTPEIICLPVTDASAPYLAWLRESTG